MPATLTVAILIDSPALLQSLQESLSGGRYNAKVFASESEFLSFIEQEKHEVDCLIFQVHSQISPVVKQLYLQGTVLPAIFLHSVAIQPAVGSADESSLALSPDDGSDFFYHASEVFVPATDLNNIGAEIDRALAQFLNLAPMSALQLTVADANTTPANNSAIFLLQQQRRLSEKLKERLGYLAIYYNRNPSNFFRHLSSEQRHSLSVQLKEQYRQILLIYFHADNGLNDLLDQFVTSVFFADLSVSEVVEIHMDLMDEFSKQLKLEGWNEDILLDYRLTLIDVIAHLCEMYRRSIPRSDQ